MLHVVSVSVLALVAVVALAVLLPFSASIVVELLDYHGIFGEVELP